MFETPSGVVFVTLDDETGSVNVIVWKSRREKVQRGLLGDVEPVGEGVCGMREFFGPGWRMYYIGRNGVTIVMLGGGDKSTQQADIAMAIALSKTIEE